MSSRMFSLVKGSTTLALQLAVTVVTLWCHRDALAFPEYYSDDPPWNVGDSVGYGLNIVSADPVSECRITHNVPVGGYTPGTVYSFTLSTQVSNGLGFILKVGADPKQQTSGTNRPASTQVSWTATTDASVTAHGLCGSMGGADDYDNIHVASPVTLTKVSTATCDTITTSSTPSLSEVCSGGSYTGALKSGASSISCASATCATSDASTCCQPTGASCNTITCQQGFEKKSDAASRHCAADPCVTNTDNSQCCQASVASCSTITCKAGFEKKVDASSRYCAADPCVTNTDNDECCVESESIILDSKISFSKTLNADSTAITFNVKYEGTGWFGVGVSSNGKMASNGDGSDMVICTGGNTVKRYWSTDYSVPVAQTGAVADGTCSYSGGRGTMTFTRTIAKSGSMQREISASGDTQLIYAYHSSSTSMTPSTKHTGRGAKAVGLLGNTSPAPAPAPSPTASSTESENSDGKFTLDDKLRAESTILGDDVSFKVTYSGASGWFGIGVSSDGTMSSNGEGSDVVVCDSTGVKRYWLTSNLKPTGGKEVAGSACEFNKGQGVMTFTRPLKAENDQQREMLASGETTIVYAHGTATTLAYHSSRGAQNVDLGSGSASQKATAVPAAVWSHAILMLLSWAAILPAGVVVARTQRKNPSQIQGLPFWFGLHKILQYVGWALQLAGFAIIAVYKNGSHFQSSVGVGVLHMVFGLIIVVIGSLQPLNACFRPHPLDETGNKSKKRKQWEQLHKSMGYFAILGGPINCILAVVLSVMLGYVTSFLVVTSLLLAFTSIPLLIFACMKGKGDMNQVVQGAVEGDEGGLEMRHTKP